MQTFEPGQLALMRAALAQVAAYMRADSSTQALMAEQILRSAKNGARSKEEFEAVATEAARSKVA
jgi:hypothetical protein